MEMEVILERKMTKLFKSWAPVLLLMVLLIAVDTFDSAAGESFLSKMKHCSIGGYLLIKFAQRALIFWFLKEP